jgi:hypothetical protein
MVQHARLMAIITNNCHRRPAVQNAKDLQTMVLFPASLEELSATRSI